MNKKGQAAMEFLMTYGWAIIIVLAAIGALAYFGVLSPQKLLPDRTTFSAPLPNVDVAVVDQANNQVAVAFRNNKGVAIKIPGTPVASMTAPTGGCASGGDILSVIDSQNSSIDYLSPAPSDIQNGAGFIVTWNCGHGSAAVGAKFKTDVTFDYINSETGQTLKQTGSIEGKWS